MNRLNFLTDILSSLFDREALNDAKTDARPVGELCEALLSGRGEMSGNRTAIAILEQFEQCDEHAQRDFFQLLLNQFDIDAEAAVTAATAYADNATPDHWRALLETTEPRRQELLRRMNRFPGATSRLVAVRKRLLDFLRDTPEFSRIDTDFEHLFTSWFNRGFLVLRQIDWDTPASILERIIRYEAVHAINDWTDLRGRLQPQDRRCFGFFHPAMPDDPLIFVEVALTRSLPDSIQSVLSPERDALSPMDADTAVFYSISNCQRGLRGISFGNFLIKQVANELKVEFPNLTTFRTLSPVPSLMRWVGSQHAVSSELSEACDVAAAFARSEAEADDVASAAKLKGLTAEYLTNQRRDDRQPMDPVARFHLGNGASLSEILVQADTSDKGLSQSAGVMVSYLYDLDAVEKNHEAYAGDRQIVASKEVQAMVAAARPDPKSKTNAKSNAKSKPVSESTGSVTKKTGSKKSETSDRKVANG